MCVCILYLRRGIFQFAASRIFPVNLCLLGRSHKSNIVPSKIGAQAIVVATATAVVFAATAVVVAATAVVVVVIAAVAV